MNKESMDALFGFILSVLLIAGGGFLLVLKVAPELASGVITLVVGFWFTQRSNAVAVNNLLKQGPSIVIPDPLVTPPGDGGTKLGQ